MKMSPLDYGRSALIGTDPGNEVRLWIESRTRVTDPQAGATEEYFQCASCKSEDTFAKRELFQEDNYDFIPVFGPDLSLIFRSYAYFNPKYRDTRPTSEMWSGPKFHLVEAGSPQQLHSDQDVFDATAAFHPIVAQTEYQDPDTGLTALIEYPVKTMNTRRDPLAYQVDTGPVMFADLTTLADRIVDRLHLAFVAFNVPGFADFVIEAPTHIGDAKPTGDTQVHHYSKRVTVESKNRLYALQ